MLTMRQSHRDGSTSTPTSVRPVVVISFSGLVIVLPPVVGLGPGREETDSVSTTKDRTSSGRVGSPVGEQAGGKGLGVRNKNPSTP